MVVPVGRIDGLKKVVSTAGIVASVFGQVQSVVDASPPEESLETSVVEEVDTSEGYFLDPPGPRVEERRFDPGPEGPTPSDTHTYLAGTPPPVVSRASEDPGPDAPGDLSDAIAKPFGDRDKMREDQDAADDANSDWYSGGPDPIPPRPGTETPADANDETPASATTPAPNIPDVDLFEPDDDADMKW